ncbi:hypothetical protein DPEC_G00123510 [Dallia pectoralis]|uniref:Uncharacterized protein n=1 Tax=Dallia pectoralis TaxID=75939 RepID=A0ACC2GQP1_DALPE|nr:hypothetical protein DPEC_G00123510 [Dallia pectoralis]
MNESPNTRRKESLFHCKSTVYTLDRSLLGHSTTEARDENQWKTRGWSGAGSTESDTPSSNGSSPLGFPQLIRYHSAFSPSIIVVMEDGSPGLQLDSASRCPLGLEAASSFPVVNPRRGRGAVSPVNSSFRIDPCSSHPPVVNAMAPPVLFPLDLLHSHERLQKEHVLPLPGGHGRVRFSVEYTSPATPLSTVRVRVVSVEGLADRGDRGDRGERGPLHCNLSLSLSPGKLQKQDSATVGNCRSLLFNEDLFFSELSRDSLDVLRLRLKVSDKASALRRGLVIGVIITEPLAQLLPCDRGGN